MKPLRLAALAQDDLREAYTWYEQRAPGLGRRLLDAVDEALVQLREAPQRFPVVHADIRRALVRSFTYSIFFREAPALIRVIAIVHQHRGPQSWQHRR